MQHDSSHHLWAPEAKIKWYLITTLDDYSRYILYAKLLEQETTYKHIKAVEEVVTTYGAPYKYYVDCHSIFRFVQGRDSLWRKHHKTTDEVDPQWKQVLIDCNIGVIYALSAPAKGKIERPYSWLQDRIVRSCVRNNITNIQDANAILTKEIYEYNHRRVHSTTGEIPGIRFNKALREGKSLFRTFEIPTPFQSHKDIFSLRIDRVADAYRKISLHTNKIKVNKINPGDNINIRIYPLNKTLSEVRFWKGKELIDIQTIKNDEFKGVHF